MIKTKLLAISLAVVFLLNPKVVSAISVCDADLTSDGYVDLSDYSVLVVNFLKTTITHPDSDINGDGMVDLSDYSIFVRYFGQMCTLYATPSPNTPTPSPTPTSSTVPTSTPSPTPSPTPTPPTSTQPVAGIWTSPDELARLPMSGNAWNAVKSAADSLANNPVPNLDNQDDVTNVRVLAAAIVYSRTGDVAYKNKVVYALSQIENFNPTGRSLAWARETGAYAMAADLIGYRTPAFERKLRDMAETYICSEQGVSMLDMFKRRPNNWGHHGFGSLTAIYTYLGDTARLQEVRDYYIASVTGAKTQARYGDLSWQCDKNNPRWINQANCVITCEGQQVNVDGIIPDDMRRGGACKPVPDATGYPWEALQGIVAGARVLERAGMPVWDAGDRAICRAASALQDGRFGNSWRAEGDDQWMLPFLDKACGTNWSASYTTSGIWQSGKNVGWGYVVQ